MDRQTDTRHDTTFVLFFRFMHLMQGIKENRQFKRETVAFNGIVGSFGRDDINRKFDFRAEQ